MKGRPLTLLAPDFNIPAQVSGYDIGPCQTQAVAAARNLMAITDLGIPLENQAMVLRGYAGAIIRHFQTQPIIVNIKMNTDLFFTVVKIPDFHMRI